MILSSAANMNNVQREKYGLSSEEIEKKLLLSERFSTLFNFCRIEKTKMLGNRLDRYDNKKKHGKKKKIEGKFEYWRESFGFS